MLLERTSYFGVTWPSRRNSAAPTSAPASTRRRSLTARRCSVTRTAKRVLLARIGNEFLAIGATCSHYGGPLAEGAVVGDTVRCPWHHACFSLRTGEALRAPALNPVASWKVERRGEKVVVTDKAERDPLSATYPVTLDRAAMPNDVVIVGAGAAGTAAAEMLRRCAYDGRITVIDDDTGSPYDRPNLSKDYLAGNAPEEWIPIRPEGFYAEHRVDIVRGRVSSVDVKAKTVSVAGQAPRRYDALLLATGAEPIHLGIPGDDQPHVHYLRSLADSRSIIAAAKDGATCRRCRRELHRARGGRITSCPKPRRRCRRAGKTPARARHGRTPRRLHSIAARIERRDVSSRAQTAENRRELGDARRRSPASG